MKNEESIFSNGELMADAITNMLFNETPKKQAAEPVETLTIELTKTQLDIIKIALSGLIGTTQNVELRTAADGLFSELMAMSFDDQTGGEDE